MADGARHLTLEDANWRTPAFTASGSDAASRDCRVSHCYLHDLGAGGVRIGQGWVNDNPPPAGPHRSLRHDNNIIQFGGEIHLGCIGVVDRAQRSDNQVTHNDIRRLLITLGVSAGWRWGYGASQAKRNHIDTTTPSPRTGRAQRHGPVYTLGPSEATTVIQRPATMSYAYSPLGRCWILTPTKGKPASCSRITSSITPRPQVFSPALRQANNVRKEYPRFKPGAPASTPRASRPTFLQLQHNIVL